MDRQLQVQSSIRLEIVNDMYVYSLWRACEQEHILEILQLYFWKKI